MPRDLVTQEFKITLELLRSDISRIDHLLVEIRSKHKTDISRSKFIDALIEAAMTCTPKIAVPKDVEELVRTLRLIGWRPHSNRRRSVKKKTLV